MLFNRMIDVITQFPKLRKLIEIAIGVALLWIILALIEHSDRAIVERQRQRGFAGTTALQYSEGITGDEQRVADLFIADTLPRLMKKGLITKYVRTEMNTTLFVVGHVWKVRNRFVKENLLTAVAVYNKVNGFNPWTQVLDDRNGTLYAQVLPPDRKEVYE